MNAPLSNHKSFVLDTMMTRIMVLVADGVSLTTLSSTLEPFQHANAILGYSRFELQLVSLRDKNPKTMAGICVSCDAQSSEVLGHCNVANRPDQVILCCGQILKEHDKGPMRTFVQRVVQSSVPLFALGAACSVVAAAGLINGEKCAAHWKTIAPLGEKFPDIKFENVLFTGDGKVASCAGELATFDLIVGFIEKTCGPRISSEICNHFLASGKRSGATVQLLNGDALICEDERFQHVLRIMTETIETPISQIEIARRVGLSLRQIERIFARHSFDPPSKYYINLRLTRARQLLEQTRMPLTEVALACGFSNLSSFSKNYRRVYGATPKSTRACFTGKYLGHVEPISGLCT
jgi:transcriptional regulator GlxA family with amidase domain